MAGGDAVRNRRSDARDFEAADAPQADRRIDATQGSEALRIGCELLFQRFSGQYRIPVDEERILILDTGVRL